MTHNLPDWNVDVESVILVIVVSMGFFRIVHTKGVCVCVCTILKKFYRLHCRVVLNRSDTCAMLAWWLSHFDCLHIYSDMKKERP